MSLMVIKKLVNRTCKITNGLPCITLRNCSIFSNLFNVFTLEKANMVTTKPKQQRKFCPISNKKP